jgi:hypothetical protein
LQIEVSQCRRPAHSFKRLAASFRFGIGWRRLGLDLGRRHRIDERHGLRRHRDKLPLPARLHDDDLQIWPTPLARDLVLDGADPSAARPPSRLDARHAVFRGVADFGQCRRRAEAKRFQRDLPLAREYRRTCGWPM